MTFVTDRTEEDVNEAMRILSLKWANMTDEDKQAFRAGLKGRYTIVDLNRVDSNVATLAQMLLQLGITVVVNTRTWTIDDIPDEIYLDNIMTIRNALTGFATTPDPPENMDRLTYTSANDIEQILLDIYTLIIRTRQSFIGSGEVGSGEV